MRAEVIRTFEFTPGQSVETMDVTIDQDQKLSVGRAGSYRLSDRSGRRSSHVRGGRAMALALGLTAVVAACGGTAEAEPEDAADTAFQRVINVEVRTLAVEDFSERIRLAGTVEANRDVMVSAEESGVVREVLTDEGASVSEGQPLLRIDDTILQAQVAEAEARAALARETWERRRRLFEEDGVGSELAYLEARYQSEQTDASLATLRERLARTVVRAPISGIFDSREPEVGTMLSPGAPVGRIVQVDPVKVTGGVPERYAADVRRGSPATVSFDVLPDEVHTGTISYVSATVNAASRTFEAELVLPNPGGVIKPEMVANIEINRRTISDAIVVPQEALVRVEDGFVAFVVVDEGGQTVAEVRPVTVATSQRNQAVIEDGLSGGDRLIVVGQSQVAGGDRVQVVGEDSGALQGAGR